MNRRRGFTLIEVGVAGVLLAVVAVVALQMLAASAAAGRAESRRRLALGEAENLLERLAARPWSDLTPEKVQDLALSRPAQESLRGVRLRVTVEPAAGQPAAKRIAVEIAPEEAAGAEPWVRLVAWRYQQPEEGRP